MKYTPPAGVEQARARPHMLALQKGLSFAAKTFAFYGCLNSGSSSFSTVPLEQEVLLAAFAKGPPASLQDLLLVTKNVSQ